MGASWTEEGNLIRIMKVCNKANPVTSPWRGDGKKDDPDLQKQHFIPAALVWNEILQLRAWGRTDTQEYPKSAVLGKVNVPGIPGHKRDVSLDPAPSLVELKQSPK